VKGVFNFISRPRFLAIALTVAVSASVFLISETFQKPLSVNNGFGWDGKYYGLIPLQFARGEKIRALEPHTHRLVTPYLASVAAKTTSTNNSDQRENSQMKTRLCRKSSFKNRNCQRTRYSSGV